MPVGRSKIIADCTHAIDLPGAHHPSRSPKRSTTGVTGSGKPGGRRRPSPTTLAPSNCQAHRRNRSPRLSATGVSLTAKPGEGQRPSPTTPAPSNFRARRPKSSPRLSSTEVPPTDNPGGRRRPPPTSPSPSNCPAHRPSRLPSALVNRGVAHGLAGRTAEAIADYTCAIDLPSTPPKTVAMALNNRAACHAKLGLHEAVLRDISLLFTLPDETAARNTLASRLEFKARDIVSAIFAVTTEAARWTGLLTEFAGHFARFGGLTHLGEAAVTQLPAIDASPLNRAAWDAWADARRKPPAPPCRAEDQGPTSTSPCACCAPASPG